MAQDNLKQKAASSMMWTAVQKYSMMIIGFISGIVLARLLTPHDYGCIGMLQIFMVLANSFIDGGFGSALIQKKNPTQTDYSTIFYWNIGMSVVMYLTLFFCAPAISRFYDMPILCKVLRVQSLVLFIYAFNTVQVNQLKKKLNFKFVSIVTISTAIISLAITIYMAYKGFGVWALVTQNLISAAIPAVANWFFVKWRPLWVFSWKSFKELFSFGFYMFLTHLLTNFSTQIQGLLIGKFYNASTMGYYSKAAGTEKIASHSISSIVSQVTYPLYAQIQDDKQALINTIKRITTTLSYATFPLMFVLILVAEPLFILLYSDRWMASIPYFQVLCIAGLPACLQAVNMQAIAAVGKSKAMFSWTLIKRVVGLGARVGGLVWFGMKGLLVGTVFSAWFSYFVNIYLVSKYVGYKWSIQLKDIGMIALVSAAAAGVSYVIGSLIPCNMYVDGIIKVVVYVIVYMGWSLIFKPDCYCYIIKQIPARFRFWEKKV